MSYLNEVMNWFRSVEGKYVDVDRKQGPQCVDGSKDWAIKEFGVPSKAYGDGRDVSRNLAKEPGWTFIGPRERAEPGDVVSWDEGWGGLWEDGVLTYYGHTAVVVRDLGDRLEVVQQNPRPVHMATLSKSGLVGYARPPRKATPPASAPYTVAKGDTFWSIAKARSLDVNQLMRLNPGISAEDLRIGTRLNLPTKTHTVAKGDTLSAVARKYGITLDALKKANPGTDPNMIYPGQVINLP